MTREEAKRILYVYRAMNLVDESHREAFDMAIKALEQEPREGHWIKYDKEFFTTDRMKPVVRSIRECSECHMKIADFSGELKYCPNCKARMEKVVKW